MSSDGRAPELAREPLALVGIGCRFPGGASSPDALWRLLAAGDDAIVEVPPDRWDLRRWYHPDPSTPGKMHVRHGGFLRESVLDWDAEFFRVAPREAARMDPQQRLLLEVAWEALEDAGVSHDSLAGSRTGVFVGGFLLDNSQLHMSELNVHLMDTHSSAGTTATMLAARLAWMFDLRGPAVTMDTACSSSLVALHYAATSLWQGDCDAALVGGVNLMLSPWMFLSVVKAGVLSPDGHCKTFAADANGYARAEGAGVVVLKTLSAALSAGDRIYALVRGTAVTQDGHTPNGIVVPSQEAQEAALRAALGRAGVRPADLQYVEAHGTGTAIGDPTETAALGTVLSEGRREPCVIGSVKANIGHLEAAAGVAGLIKAALCLHHGAIPPHRYLDDLNPKIEFDRLGLRLPHTLEPWPETAGARLAGVNSFGYGGTNAHVVLEAAPPAERVPSDPPRPWVLPLSARSDAALHALADQWIALLGADPPPLGDLCHTAARRRSHHDRRLMVVAEDAVAARTLLAAFRAGETRDGLATGRARDRAALVWVFTGMGPQWWGMGRELLATEPVFRAAIEEVHAELLRRTDFDLMAELMRPETSSRMATTRVAQTTGFALQVALGVLWRSWGVSPDAVVGHSLGEVAAMYIAGALSLEDACWISHERARLQARTAGQGGMLATELTPDQATAVIGHRGAEVSIAAINGPSATTLAGDLGALDQIAALLDARNVFNKRLRVEVAYHSPAMDPLRDELLVALSDLRPRPATTPLYSTVYGRRIDGREIDAGYWWENVRGTVRFADTAVALLEAGHEVFLEIGPHPVLAGSIQECAAGQTKRPVLATSLRRDKPEQHTMLHACGVLYAAGVAVDWVRLAPAGNHVRLPAYTWQRQRHWVESAASRDLRAGGAARHPLLGLPVPGPIPAWESDVGAAGRPYLGDHAIEHQPILPAAAYLELAFAAARELGGAGPVSLDEVVLHRALALGKPVAVRVSVDHEGERFTIHSRPPQEGAEWTLHASGRLRVGVAATTAAPAPAERVEEVEPARIYSRLAERGYHYGPAFQGLTGLRRGDGVVIADVVLPAAVPAGDRDGYLFHPSLLDACLQSVLAVQSEPVGGGLGLHLPVGFRRITLHRPAGPVLRCYGRITDGAGSTTADLRVVDAEGELVAEIEGVVLRALTEASGVLPPMYRFEWDVAERGDARRAPPGTWVLVHDGDPLGPAVADLLTMAGHRVVCVPRGVSAGPEALTRVLEQAGPEVRGVVLLRGLERDGATSAADRAIAGAGELLALVQAVLQGSSATPPRLWIVTRGAQAVGDTRMADAPDGAASWGLARVVRSEQPASAASTIDLDPLPADDEPAAVAAELLAAGPEHEIAFRGRVRHVHRLRPWTLAAPEPRVQVVVAKEADLLLEGRGWRTSPVPMPRDGEVAVRVHAAGFDAGTSAWVAGEVTAVGEGAHHAVGDRVVALAGGLGSHVVVRGDRAAPLPHAVPPTAAAGLGAVMSAVHVLDRVARVQAGDRLRIGEVSLALAEALREVASARGARVVTDREEADLIVGAAWPSTRALDGLARGGRWVVLGPAGARGEFDPAALGLRGLSLSVVDPAAELGHDNAAVGRALGAAVGFGARADRATVFAADRLAAAVENAERGAATVIAFGDERVSTTAAGGVPVFSSATYLVTGGLSGLGLAAAEWLVGLGARHLVLVSRRGSGAPGAAEAVERLRARGVTVSARAVDVTHTSAVEHLVEELGRSPHPLRGVVHAANVYGDWSTLDQLTPAELARVMAPKVVGAWNLHRATAALELDLFVVTSSLASCIGGVGFGAYAAGNACLDALVHHRRAEGRAALAVNFGGIADIGLLEEDDAIAVRTASFGARRLPVSRVLAATAALLAAGETQAAVAEQDWRAWAAVHSGFAESPEFAELFSSVEAGPGDVSGAASGPRAALLAAAPDERLHLLAAHLRRLTARVLATAEDAVDLDLSLRTLGIDSLMSTELKASVNAELGLDVPILALIRGPSLHTLAGSLLAGLVPESTPADELAALERELAAIEALSTRDVEEALVAPEGER